MKYHKWRLRERNCEPGDVVLVLDREGPKGKFTLGQIDSVKVDPDNVVRKVTVKYKLPQKGDTLDLVPMPYKFAERNVRGLALVITAQEREEVESVNLDDLRSDKQIETVSNRTDDENNQSREDHEDDDNVEETQDLPPPETEATVDDEVAPRNNEDDAFSNPNRMLPPTSSGRRRLRPSKLNL